MIKYPIYVTIDTNILDGGKYNFEEKSPLQLLVNYVNKGKVKVVLSNIVIKEAEKHIAEKAEELCNLVEKLKKDALKYTSSYQIEGLGMGGIMNTTFDVSEIRQKSIALLRKYISDIQAEILDTSNIKWDEIIDDYFAVRAPFESKKRKEFPDAFIASQIKERFGETEVVAIISNDNGFKAACKNWENHLFFSSLGDFYNALSEQEALYSETVKFITSFKTKISSEITEYIVRNEYIEVRGLSYDRKGGAEGYDYTDTKLKSLSSVSIGTHSVDEIEENKSIVTLKCKGNFVMDCLYQDYENAPWDSEEKEYVYVDTVGIREEHEAIFACRIEINRSEKSFEILPFKVILGGDSRKDRYEIESDLEYDYEKEIEDMGREAVGLNSLNHYETYLKENLTDSKIQEDIIKRFNIIDELHGEYDEISCTYDSLLEQFSDNIKIVNVIQKISSELEEISDFPRIIDEEDISEDEILDIKKWANFKYEDAIRKMEERNLPDCFHYGDEIEIIGIDNQKLYLKIDEININPSAGEKEWIDISLSNETEKIASGTIELTVGYIEYDEDGGVADGLGDDIDYYYDSIIEQLDSFIATQNEYLDTEKTITRIIEEVIE